MNTLKGLLWSSENADVCQSYSQESTTISDLVDKVREEHGKLETLERQIHTHISLNDTQRKALDDANTEITQLKKTVAGLNNNIAANEKTIRKLTNNDTNKQRQIQRLQNEVKQSKTQQQQLQQQVASLQISNSKLNTQSLADRTQASQDLNDLQRENIDLQFDLQSLKHTHSSSISESTRDKPGSSLISPPFVLVLVDGDAYEWAASHWTKCPTSPGGHAAQAIKTEVQKHLLDNKERIPLQCRIVTRVYMNLPWRADPQSKNARPNALQEFAKTFTESTPLFDFSDAGEGKERVDEKIKETFHLFALNPSCHAIFFAAARDNGFARLLEQYNYVPEVKSKVVIIHPGYIARELALLNYTSTEWPSVFKHQYMTQMESVKERRVIASKARRSEESSNAFKAQLHRSYSESVVLPPLTIKPATHYGVFRNLQVTQAPERSQEESIVVEEID